MLCTHVITESLMDYLDGTLPERERAEFELHLGMCRSCRVYLETYRRTVEAAKASAKDVDAALPPPPEDLVKAILASVPKHERGPG